jgi:hypothetical protein
MVSSAGMAALSTSLYLVAASAALVQAMWTKRSDDTGNVGLWFGAAILLYLAAAMRLLDAHVILASILHHQLSGSSWYEWRRVAQMSALIFAAILAGMGVIYALKSRLVSRIGEKIAFASLLLLILLVAARTLSLHATDALLGLRYGLFKVVWLIEAGLLATFISSVLLTIMRPIAVRR